MLSLRDPGEFAQRCKIYLNKVWYRLRVLGCQWHIPTKKSPPPPRFTRLPPIPSISFLGPRQHSKGVPVEILWNLWCINVAFLLAHSISNPSSCLDETLHQNKEMTTLLQIDLQTQRYKVCFSVAHIIIRCIKSISKTAMTELHLENPLFVWQAVLVIEISALASEPALHFKPVARIFYGEVLSNEETDRTMPKAQVSGVGRI